MDSQVARQHPTIVTLIGGAFNHASHVPQLAHILPDHEISRLQLVIISRLHGLA